MFQLIVAVISIALVAALAIASIYYGGQAFQKSSLKANVTTLVNGGQQIAGAQALYKTDNSGISAKVLTSALPTSLHNTAPTVDKPTYLAAVPGISGAATGDWTLNAEGDVAYVPVLNGATADDPATAEICVEAERQAGVTGATAASIVARTAPAKQFGCYAVTVGGPVVFGFKL